MTQRIELHDQQVVDDLHHSSVFMSKYRFLFGVTHDLNIKGYIEYDNLVKLLQLTNAALFVLHIEIQNNEAEARYEKAVQERQTAYLAAIAAEVESMQRDIGAVMELQEVAPFGIDDIPEWLRDIPISDEGGNNGAI